MREAVAKHAVSGAAIPTRWEPVDLACVPLVTSSSGAAASELIVVRAKLVRGPKYAAMCVSEAVSHCVLEKLNFEMAEPFAIHIDARFADALTKQFRFADPVLPGRHWATRFLPDGFSMASIYENVADIADPSSVFRLYLADVVLAHRDRNTEGNVLLTTKPSGKRPVLVPIDQSDCFGGPSVLMDAAELTRLRNRPIGDPPTGMERVLWEQKPSLEAELKGLQAAKGKILECPNAPFQEWYDRSGVNRQALLDLLDHRVSSLRELARIDHWAAIRDATGGGHVLDFK